MLGSRDHENTDVTVLTLTLLVHMNATTRKDAIRMVPDQKTGVFRNVLLILKSFRCFSASDTKAVFKIFTVSVKNL